MKYLDSLGWRVLNTPCDQTPRGGEPRRRGKAIYRPSTRVSDVAFERREYCTPRNAVKWWYSEQILTQYAKGCPLFTALPILTFHLSKVRPLIWAEFLDLRQTARTEQQQSSCTHALSPAAYRPCFASRKRRREEGKPCSMGSVSESRSTGRGIAIRNKVLHRQLQRSGWRFNGLLNPKRNPTKTNFGRDTRINCRERVPL